MNHLWPRRIEERMSSRRLVATFLVTLTGLVGACTSFSLAFTGSVYVFGVPALAVELDRVTTFVMAALGSLGAIATIDGFLCLAHRLQAGREQ